MALTKTYSLTKVLRMRGVRLLFVRFALSALLVFAGFVHLLRPDLFDPAIPFPWKSEINLLSGLLEIALGVGLWTRRWRDPAARLCALWFLALIPIHIYTSLKAIPVFGVSAPALLWARTFFQPVLFFLALSLQKEGWIMAQRWREVIFLHYEVDPRKLQEKVPFPLDLYDGKAIVSIVPFTMANIRFRFLPSVPGFSSMLELNLRTYVKVDGRPGVYFFTLDSNHPTAVLIARWFFSLAYRWRKLVFSHQDVYEFSSPEFSLRAKVGEPIKASAFDLWATERYALFTKRGQTNLCGVVEHRPWALQKIELLSVTDHFSAQFGEELRARAFCAMAYSRELPVRFRPFFAF